MDKGRFDSDVVFANVLQGRATLKCGDQGPAVEVLQQALGDMGFPMRVLKNGITESGVDGKFGRQTEIALRNFQEHARKKHHNVDVTGAVDGATLQALIALAPAPGKKAWDSGQPNHAPAPYWNGDHSKTLRVAVVKDEHRTFLFDTDGTCIGIFPNAHGSDGNATDPGLKRVRTKIDEPGAKAAGRDRWKTDRAFGARILDLSWVDGRSHGEELHGTYEYHTMGTDVSHGCVRHYNEDIIVIFDAVKVGDLVAIAPSVHDPRLRESVTGSQGMDER